VIIDLSQPPIALLRAIELGRCGKPFWIRFGLRHALSQSTVFGSSYEILGDANEKANDNVDPDG